MQTLKSIEGHRYQLEESTIADGNAPRITLTERENSVAIGHAPVNLPNRNYECTIWASRQISEGRRTSLRFYTPEGQYQPVGITFQSSDSDAKLMVVGDEEEISALGRTFLCTRLEGDVRYGERVGRMTVWHSSEVPGSEIRSRLVLRDKDGEFVQDVELIELHEAK